MRKKSLSLLIVLAVLLGVVACGQPQAAALAKIVSNSLAQLAVIDTPNESAYSKASGIMLNVSNEIAAWKTGTPADNIINGLNSTVTILNSVHAVDPQTGQLIILATTTAEAIIALYPPSGMQAKVKAQEKPGVQAAPRSEAEYKARWNAIAPAKGQLK